MKTYSILIAGIGGQGVLWLSKVIASAASQMYPHVCRTESRGLSQRGGSVCSGVRFGYLPATPVTTTKSEDLVLALDALEGARMSHCLKEGGVVLTNQSFVAPSYVIAGWNHAGDAEQKIAALEKKIVELWQRNDYAINLEQVSAQSARPLNLNNLLLGVASVVIPIQFHVLKTAMLYATPEKDHEAAITAIESGRKTMLECVERRSRQLSVA